MIRLRLFALHASAHAPCRSIAAPLGFHALHAPIDEPLPRCARRFAATLAVSSLLLLAAVAARGQGTVVVDRPLPHPHFPTRITSTPLDVICQRIYVEITDGVAVTQVHQTLRNPLPTAVEGTYVFPLAEEVALGDFSMTVDGKTLRGEVLDKDQARNAYESIVRSMRDPGLLEFIGTRLFRASIAPIPAGGQIDVKLAYSNALREQSGLGHYQHALRAGGASDQVIRELVISVRIKSTLPLLNVFSPTHECAVTRPSDLEARISYERTQVQPDRDFQLYYQRKDQRFGISLLTHRRPGEPGYFLLRLAPRIEAAADDAIPKDIAFVVDTSGSMRGEKIAQARRALKFCIDSLSPSDRFNIYPFATDVRPFRDALVTADADVRDDALRFAEKLEADGGTNIWRALRTALDDDPRDAARPYLVVFMTDGHPTIEETDPARILKQVREKNARGVRFHVLGVGNDVATDLLDKLAEMNRGSRDYCIEGEDLELKLSGLAGRLAHPLLADLSLQLEGLGATDVYPALLPDLFKGGDIVVMGRYDAAGRHTVKLRGKARDRELELTYEAEFDRHTTENEFLPRLWAQRKVAFLVDQIRLHGRSSELENEVVRLATRHGIVTPFTSSLILEDRRGPLASAAAPVIRRSAQRAAPASVGNLFGTPQASRELALGKNAYILKDDAETAAATRDGAALRRVRDKAFAWIDGRFVDTEWDGKRRPHKIAAFSDEYFALLQREPLLREYLAIDVRVLLVWNGQVLEITAPEEKH